VITYKRDKIVYLHYNCGLLSDLNVSYSVITFLPDDVIVFNVITFVLFLSCSKTVKTMISRFLRIGVHSQGTNTADPHDRSQNG
jgi:hypothetical protein